MTRRRLATIALCTTAVLAPFAACNVYDETLLLAEGGASSSSGGLPAGRGVGYWSGTGDVGCPSARKPTLADKPRNTLQKDIGAIVLGLRHIDLGTTNPYDGGRGDQDYKRLGFDVDGLCSGSSSTCGTHSASPGCAPRQGTDSIDGEYCRDNTFGQLSDTLTYASEVTSGLGFGTFDCALCYGQLNFLVRIQGYNGEADDDAIEVDFFPSSGIEGGPLPLDCRDNVPDDICFSKASRWNIDRAVVEGTVPGASYSKLRSTQAFVKESYVTIFLPDAMRIYFPGDAATIHAFPIVVHQGFITGRLGVGVDGRWRVDDGMIGGATAIDEVLQSLNDIGVCKGDQNFTSAQNVVENVADVLVSGELSKTTPCNAVSVGVGFTALEATLGDKVEVAVPDYCSGSADAGTDAGRDSGARDGG